MITNNPPDTMPATAPGRLVRFQNREHTTSGPKAEPRPAHASETSPMILLSGFHAMMQATTAITRTVIRLTFNTFLSSASGFRIFLKISFDAEEAQTRSWESAVDIMAARIPQRNKPPIKIKTMLPSKIC